MATCTVCRYRTSNNVTRLKFFCKARTTLINEMCPRSANSFANQRPSAALHSYCQACRMELCKFHISHGCPYAHRLSKHAARCFRWASCPCKQPAHTT
ncbi:hypothetical protein AA106555_1456 [Neokomagataea thailandica NBRC 106555]|uniref:Uncharacterized protein n=1 Tax=Neokomagataea thailandica NBRC 106555 TaxID=1223520 RepID=A0ABQ0QR05_9PROT|nr:hypothetical protein AA106555_1456 [Neokomagataea thailandica NBRC 106555]